MIALAVALVVTSATGTPVRAQPTCLTSWTEAGPIVRREGLATVERVGRLLRDTAALEIVTSALCTTEGRYVYRLTVRPKRGALTTLVVDARQPAIPKPRIP